MAALVWLLIPLAAAVVAAIWARWATHRRSDAGDGESLAGYERFREAMGNSVACAGAAGAAGGVAADSRSKAAPESGEDSPRGPVAGQVP